MERLLKIDSLKKDELLPFVMSLEKFDWKVGEDENLTKMRMMYLESHNVFDNEHFSTLYLSSSLNEKLEEQGIYLNCQRLVKCFALMLVGDVLEEKDFRKNAYFFSSSCVLKDMIELLSWCGITQEVANALMYKYPPSKEIYSTLDEIGLVYSPNEEVEDYVLEKYFIRREEVESDEEFQKNFN